MSATDFFVPPSPYTAADVAATASLTTGGNSQTLTISPANKIGLAAFAGEAGQRVNLGVTGVTIGTSGCCGLTIYVYKPDGTQLTSKAFGTTADALDMQLPVSGTYTFLIDPAGVSTGNITLTLSEEVNAGTIVSNGASLTTTIVRLGQRARGTFDGSAGQRVNLGVTGVTIGTSGCCGLTIYVYKPDGTLLTSKAFGTIADALDMQLSVNGTYTFLIDPAGVSTGNITLTLSEEVNIGTLTVGGSAVTVGITRLGQNARGTFSGTANQLVTVRITSNTISNVTVKLLRPDGTTQTSSTSSAASFTLTQQTLATTGTYTVVVDPAGVNTGSLNVQVTSP